MYIYLYKIKNKITFTKLLQHYVKNPKFLLFIDFQ